MLYPQCLTLPELPWSLLFLPVCQPEQTPCLVDVSIEMPEELDISALQGTGLQDGEEEMPDIAPPLVTPDEPKGSLGFYGNEDDDSFCSPHFSSPTC